MNRLRLALGVTLLAATIASLAGAVAANSANITSPRQISRSLSNIQRFDGIVTIQKPSGGTQSLHVTIRDWIVFAAKVKVTIPTQGFTVAHLVAGSITTSAGGASPLERKSNPFWSVKSGAPLSVVVTSEAATIETISSKPINL